MDLRHEVEKYIFNLKISDEKKNCLKIIAEKKNFIF